MRGRSIRGWVVPVLGLVIATSVVGCDDADPAGPDNGLAGTWTLASADGQTLPAMVLITQYVDDEGIVRQLDHQIVTGSIELAGAGTYEQRVQRRVYEGEQLVYAGNWTDRGLYTVAGATVHFESTLYQNVAFEGAVQNGRLLLTEDVMGEAVPTELSFRR